MPASACTWLSDPELLITFLHEDFFFFSFTSVLVAFIAYTCCSEKKNGEGNVNPKGGRAAPRETAADGHGITQFANKAQSGEELRTSLSFFFTQMPLSIVFRSMFRHCEQSFTLLILLAESRTLPLKLKCSLGEKFKPKHQRGNWKMCGSSPVAKKWMNKGVKHASLKATASLSLHALPS